MGKIFNNQVGFDRWNRGTEWPMAIISLVFLGVYAYVVIGNLNRTGFGSVLFDSGGLDHDQH